MPVLRTANWAYVFKPPPKHVRAYPIDAETGPAQPSYRIDRKVFFVAARGPPRAYNQSSEAQGLTFLAGPCFSAGMTQRNIHRTQPTTAMTAARMRAVARLRGVEPIAALVLVVVVLITSPTGAG
jgi:hypothetical protein